MGRKFRSFYVGALAVAGVALLGSLFVSKAHADAWDKTTIVRVNEPIIAGNKVLEPGTYVWKLLDSQSDRHIVQIFDEHQQHLEETILAIPNYRLQPTEKSQFAFWETPNGVPKAVRAWFYPGDNYGQELPYPKKLVEQLASAAPVPLPAATQPVEPPAAQPAPEPPAAPAAEQSESAPAPEPAAPAPEAAAPSESPAPQPAALPKTSTLNPLFGILGIGSIGVAGLLSLVSKRA